MPRHEPIALTQLRHLLARAKREAWRHLALLGRSQPLWRTSLLEQGWPEERVFVLEVPLSRLPPALTSLSDLTSLDLSYNDIGDDGAQAIASHLTDLTSLSLGNNRIKCDGAREIATRLSRLTSLGLFENSIGHDGALAIATHMARLTSLDLEGNDIDEDTARAVAEGCFTRLRSLNLARNSVKDDGVRAIASHLTGLTSVDLRESDITDDGVLIIARFLSRLKSLNLADNDDIGVVGAHAIADNLTGLQLLDLRGSNITDGGARHVAERLTRLRFLGVWNSNIQPETAQTIAQRLTHLTSLDLSHNFVENTGARAIAGGRLSRLTSLALADNDIADEGARYVVRGFPRLTSLDLADNDIGDDGVREISMLEHLESLDLTGCSCITDEGARMLVESCRSLIWLDLNECHELSLPREVCDSRDAAAIRAHYQTERRLLAELKLLIVGEGGTGKTHLRRRLAGAAQWYRREHVPTHNVAMARWLLTAVLKRGAPPQEVSLRVWDFGGQPNLHATHRFFLDDQRGIFVLVLDATKSAAENKLHYWLKYIRYYTRPAGLPKRGWLRKAQDAGAHALEIATMPELVPFQAARFRALGRG